MSTLRRLAGLTKTLAIYYGKPLRLRRERRLYGDILGLGPGSLGFDIGAHVGNRVRTWLTLGAEVVAVEPQSGPLSILRRLYGGNPRLFIVPGACGPAEGTQTLHVCETSPTLSTLSAGWIDRVREAESFRGIRWDSEELVPVTTLDRLIEAHGMPDFVKIDVEGFEADVLAGLSSPVPQLSFEFLPASIEVALRCVDMLADLGDYEYNYSMVETMKMVADEWLRPEELKDRLSAMPRLGPSGDAYARLRGR